VLGADHGRVCLTNVALSASLGPLAGGRRARSAVAGASAGSERPERRSRGAGYDRGGSDISPSVFPAASSASTKAVKSFTA
jgi:hypothetical protein